MNIFEQATRLNLRFGSAKGNLTVEDLWKLPLLSESGASLDEVAKYYNKMMKETNEESFVVKKSIKNNIAELKLDIAKHIIKVRLDEDEASANAVLAKAKKQKIMAIIADKQDEGLKGQSVEDLQKMLDEL